MSEGQGQDEIVDVLASIRGTRKQIATMMRRMATTIEAGIRLSRYEAPGNDGAGNGELDVLTVADPCRPRISNRTVLAADASGMLAIYDQAMAAESAMRLEGDGVAGA